MKTNLLKKLAKVTCSVSAAAMFVAAPNVQAKEGYPERPVTIVVPYSAGGATDFQARIVTMMAEQYLGQPMVIVNKPGAGGQVGWNSLIERGGKEGYDLATYNVPHFIAQSLTAKTKYNVNNLEPIANWGADPAVLIVSKNSPFNTVEDLVKFAKENPGKVSVSGAGKYVGHHIATLQLEKAADVKLTYIPTDGGVDALKFVIGGQVKAGFNNLSDAYRSQDQIKILAIADTERDQKFLPNVPTFQERGIDVDDASNNLRGLMTVKGVPDERLQLLSTKAVEMFKDPKVQKKLSEGGSPVKIMTRDEVQQFWAKRQNYLEGLLGDLTAK